MPKFSIQMKPSLLKLFGLCVLLSDGFAANAFQHPEQSELPNLDVRQNAAPNTNQISAAHEAGVSRLMTKIADVRIGLDDRQPRPNFVARRDGFLTGPAGSGAAISPTALNKFPVADPQRVTKAFLNEHPAVFGHDASALTNAVIKRDYV
ncbi:MAG: hypothetical protein RL616_2455, partial [Verrucomicrobiota bacterium]